MLKMVSLQKRSKKQQKQYHQAKRGSWNGVNPVTRSVPSGKIYDRARDKSCHMALF